jgi:glyoxylase-like metal-dependent hydrolase (beta-lactamase superfamily II)
MPPAPNRRDFLQILLGGAALSLASGASAQHAGGPIAATRLGDRVSVFSGAGGNVIALDGPESLLLVNGGTAERSAPLLKAIAGQFGAKPVATLFNTDWHPEHTGSNETVATSGGRVVAHEHTKQYLATERFVEWQNRTYPSRPRHALPTETFYTKGSLTFGGEPIEYGHLGQAHTDGDIYVFLRASNVLVTGDVVSVGTYPIADYTTGGWLGGLANATKTLVDVSNAETRVVPGAGPLQTRADLQAQHEMLTAMRDRLAKMMRQGMGTEDMLASGVTREFDAKWGDPTLFVSTAYRGLWLHVRELGGVV